MAKKNDIVKATSVQLQQLENIENLIRVIRGKQVMLDRDLARLYGVETRVLNQAVQRNIERFPEDFMFQLSKEEFENWKSQFAISNYDEDMSSQFATTSAENMKSQITTSSGEEKWKSQIVISNSIKMGARKLPYAFTENGIAMLSSVLRSQQAISINIQVMRAFNAMRHFIGSQAQVFQRLEVVERNQLALTTQVAENNKKLEEVFRRLDDHSENPSVLTMLDKRNKGVDAVVYTKNISRQLSLDFEKHNAQYSPIEVKQFDRAHDRFLCIDDTVYLIGASLKDLGKKWFGFVKLEQPTDELLSKM